MHSQAYAYNAQFKFITIDYIIYVYARVCMCTLVYVLVRLCCVCVRAHEGRSICVRGSI